MILEALFLAFGRIVIGFLAVVGFVQCMNWLAGSGGDDNNPVVLVDITKISSE